MSTEMTLPHHASDEMLAAFAEGRLHGRDRDEVLRHVADCDECRDILDALWEAQDAKVIEESHGNVITGRFGWAKGLAAIAAAVVVAAFVPQVREPIRDRIDFYRTGGVSELVKTSKQLDEWPLQTRLSGGFAIPKNLRKVTRGEGNESEPEKEADEWLLDSSAETVLDRANPKTAKGQHAIGLAHLLHGNRKAAISALERAAAMQHPADPALLTDLAAAHLQGGDSKRGLELAKSSWRLAKSPESTWNLAYAYEQNGQYDDAVRMYREYLKLDATSSFASEAREGIERYTTDLRQP